MIKNHDFRVGDIVVVEQEWPKYGLLKDVRYSVLDTAFFSILVLDKDLKPIWVNANKFQHTIRVTATKKHLTRIVFGR